MTSLRRGFVALVPSTEALDHVDAAVAPVRDRLPKLRWMPRAQWHLTLQFLGHLDDADAVVDALRAGVAADAPFTVRLGGGGAFAKARAGTVLWLGVRDGGDALHTLAAAVTVATAPLGFVTEDRVYRPHLTVARAARPTDLRAAVSGLDAVGPGPTWTATEVVLFESDTRPDGAVHTVVARCPLALGEAG
jgi:RNA 2',3'-cyclic 3'-phosphodiesterase